MDDAFLLLVCDEVLGVRLSVVVGHPHDGVLDVVGGRVVLRVGGGASGWRARNVAKRRRHLWLRCL